MTYLYLLKPKFQNSSLVSVAEHASLVKTSEDRFSHDVAQLCYFIYTDSEEPLSKDNIDAVCSEIGQEWRRLCRKMGFSDGECDQFRQDFYVSGTYEIMYQVIAIAFPLCISHLALGSH